MKSLLIYFISTLVLNTYELGAEILTVTADWDNQKCNKSCSELLQKQYEKVNGINSVRVDRSGLTTFSLKPNAKFSYEMVKRPMQRVGVGLNGISIKVRGHAIKQGNRVYLISENDGTKFELISSINSEGGAGEVKPNPIYRGLSPDLTDQILGSAKEGKIMVIEGPLYQPHRSLQIIVSHVLIERPEK